MEWEEWREKKKVFYGHCNKSEQENVSECIDVQKHWFIGDLMCLAKSGHIFNANEKKKRKTDDFYVIAT